MRLIFQFIIFLAGTGSTRRFGEGRLRFSRAKKEDVLHGPYNVWTRKVKGKTVTRNLTDEQAQLCRECVQNLRKVEEIIEQMKALTAEYIEDSKKTRHD